MCGKKAKMHPFFDPLIGLWGNIESLRHTPPCLHPPRLAFFSPVDHTLSSDDFESQNSFGNVTIFQQSPRHESWSDNSEMPEAIIPPCFSATGRLCRPVHAFDKSNFYDLHSRVELNSEPSTDFPQYGFLPDGINPSFSMGTNNSSAQPFPSTASIVRIFYKDGTKQFPQPNPKDLEFIPYSRHALENVEGDFNDSGLHLPLGEGPEPMGCRKDAVAKIEKQLEQEVSIRHLLIIM